MLPLLGAAATGALSAGMKGVQNFVSGEEQEEQAKKQALKNLSNRFQAGTGGMTFASAPEIPKAPSFAETVVAPMAQSAVSNAAGSALGSAMSPAKAAAPVADAHGDYQAGFDAKLAARKALNPAAMPSQAEEDFYLRGGR